MAPYDPLLARNYRQRRAVAIACTVVFYGVLVGFIIFLFAAGGLNGGFSNSPVPVMVLLVGGLAMLALRFGYRCPSCGAPFGKMSGFWPVAFDACPSCGAGFVPDQPEGSRPAPLSDDEVVAQYQLSRARFRQLAPWSWLLMGGAFLLGFALRRLALVAFAMFAVGIILFTALASRYLRCPRCHQLPIIAGSRGGVMLDADVCPNCGARLK